MIVNRFWRVVRKGAGTYMSLLGVLRRWDEVFGALISSDAYPYKFFERSLF